MTKHGILTALFSSLIVLTFPSFAEETTDDRPSVTKNKIDVSEILGRDPSKEDYVVETECITASRIESMEVIDKKHIIVEMKADDYFLIQFKNNCQDLRKNLPVW